MRRFGFDELKKMNVNDLAKECLVTIDDNWRLGIIYLMLSKLTTGGYYLKKKYLKKAEDILEPGNGIIRYLPPPKIWEV